MGFPKTTLERWWSRVRYERRTQLKWATFFMLFLSLLFSLGTGLITFFGWISLGIMGVLLLYRRLDRYFFIVLWLFGIYGMIFTGGLITFSFYERSGNSFLLILGYSILASSFLLTWYLWYYLKERRDTLALEGNYVPMGLYFLILFLFYWSAIFGTAGFIRWADESLGNPGLYKALYFFANLILIPSIIYLSGYPEDRFIAYQMSFMTDGGFFRNIAKNLSRGDFKVKKMKGISKRENVCPLCNKGLTKEIRKCPSCDSPRFFYWCDKDEEYLVRCPNCSHLTPLGRERCIHCSIRISSRIKCSRCGSINSVNEWVPK